MPFYDFDCPACGRFTAIRPMALSAAPCACLDCGASAPRALSAPAIVRGRSGPSHRADTTTVKARPAGPAHPAGCGCCARRSPALNRVAAAGGRIFRSHGPIRAESP